MAPLRHDFSPSSILGKFLRCGMDPLSGIHAAGNFPFYTGTQGAPGGAPQRLKTKPATPQLPFPPTTPPPLHRPPTHHHLWIHECRGRLPLINDGQCRHGSMPWPVCPKCHNLFAEMFLKSPPRHFEKYSDRDLLKSLPIALSFSGRHPATRRCQSCLAFLNNV